MGEAYQKVKGEDATKAKFFDEELEAGLNLLAKSLPAGSGPWLVGSKISYADICVYNFLTDKKGFFDDADKAKAAYSKVARVNAAMEAVDANADVQAWIA